ncbi:N-acetyl-gamma-glutamyl-phosphate reductase [Ammoniphilus sp. 3BR4]|uniref:N-acetyl-gamma-glutamyl-phosphate reductase n=1 Tax=Ammoniphilus sp. 3BR4 TaxID=3158265 RepID=UPI003467D22F
MIRAGIYGASGYMGAEALRVLLRHPNVSVEWATSRGDTSIEVFNKNFFGRGIQYTHPDDITPCDVVFVSVPSGLAMDIAAKFLSQGAKVIDFGADFRLKNKEDWERVYGKTHSQWNLVSEAVYGITELHRKDIKSTRLVANPGCFSSSTILALAPLVREGLIDLDKIVVDGMSGTVGAGNELDRALHHPEIHNNILSYNVVNHRHTYEMEQELSALAGQSVHVHFTPHYVPISRGILTVNHCFPTRRVKRKDLIELYQEFYRNEFFVKVIDLPSNTNGSWNYAPYPWISAVSSTNFCHIGLDVDESRGRIVVLSVLDSVGKGGALVGIENMNVMFGLDETTGLDTFGIHPY